MCCCCNTGVESIPKNESLRRKLTLGNKILLLRLLRPSDHKSGALPLSCTSTKLLDSLCYFAECIAVSGLIQATHRPKQSVGLAHFRCLCGGAEKFSKNECTLCSL